MRWLNHTWKKKNKKKQYIKMKETLANLDSSDDDMDSDSVLGAFESNCEIESKVDISGYLKNMIVINRQMYPCYLLKLFQRLIPLKK